MQLRGGRTASIKSHILRASFIPCLVLLLLGCGGSGSGSPVSLPAENPIGQSPGSSETPDNTDSPGNSAGDPTSPANDPDSNGPTDPVADTITALAPLPSPPLTPAPAAGDEPVPISREFATATEYFVVRNPSKLPRDTSEDITVEDFQAGGPDPVVFTPAHVNPEENSAPYFLDLDDQTIIAGQTMNLRLRPIDPDGSVPGMFPEAIPEGARYIDNFDGTRTLQWRPLQPDVGIREFTITAVDPVEPLYRTRRTIRIRVVMPSDPSSIINLPPVINEVRVHTVRVNDPVVIQIKGDDPNGTIPSLQLLNPPAGHTFVQDPIEPAIKVLRFIPEAPGTLNIQVRAIDPENTSLQGNRTISVNVKARSEFERPGSRLRNLALARNNFLIGYASLMDYFYRPDGTVYADIAAEEFNFVTTENSLKWDLVNPLPGRYRWAAADNITNFARVNGLKVHGHTLVWYRQLPGWIKRSALAERETHMREYIDRVLKRYASRIPVWDVVNEAFEDNGDYRNSVWYQAMGSDYIETAFRQARASAPNAQLLYNEYDVSWKGPKAEAMFTMLQSLKDRDVPVDGVGFQMHLFADFNRFDEVVENFQRAANMGLDIYVTELDVSLRNGTSLEQQAGVYEQVLDICLEQPRCKGFQSWGFTDMYSWRRNFDPLLFDEAYQVKPAYLALQRRLGQN